jgi:hypothetical protein
MLLTTIIKKIHMYAGLQATVALFLFCLSIIVITFPVKPEPQSSELTYAGPQTRDSLEMARSLHAEFGGKSEKLPQSWMVTEGDSGPLSIQYYSPNGHRTVLFDRHSKAVRIIASPSGVSRFLEYMHEEHVGRRDWSDSAWLWAWSLYMELSIIALFTLPVTGIYIWLSSRPDQRWAQSSLAVSVVGMMIHWNLVR